MDKSTKLAYTAGTMDFPMRINKYLANMGFSTRKGADDLIASGRVTINGRVAKLGEKMNEGDEVKVKGTQKTYRYYAYNKPVGVVTHSAQTDDEKDILEATSLKDVFPIGRLDKASSGLIILTNDGRVTDRLLNPEYEHTKEYRVTTVEDLPSYFKDRMEKGVDIEGYMTKPCEVRIFADNRFTVTLTEGKKHQIRRMCAALGVAVKHLERTRVMNISLGSMKPGTHRLVEGVELQTFLKSLGL